MRHVNVVPTAANRLVGRHLPVQIPLPPGSQKKLFRTCVVCAPAWRKMNAQAGIKSKRAGRESQYQCDVCEVALCVTPCFEYYHKYTDFVKKYIDEAK